MVRRRWSKKGHIFTLRTVIYRSRMDCCDDGDTVREIFGNRSVRASVSDYCWMTILVVNIAEMRLLLFRHCGH